LVPESSELHWTPPAEGRVPEPHSTWRNARACRSRASARRLRLARRWRYGSRRP